MTEDGAKEWLDASPINFGTAMIKCGDAKGLVSGAIHSTGDTVRPALQIIKTKPGIKTVSSVFFMVLKDRVLVYGDCAIVPEPTVDDLASIGSGLGPHRPRVRRRTHRRDALLLDRLLRLR